MHPDTLRQLIVNCRSAKTRMLGFPRDWRPHTIPNPHFPDMPLTDASAWELAADYLAGGGGFYELSLDVPPGALAICFEIGRNAPPPIYVKIEVRARVAVGRSFHLSER